MKRDLSFPSYKSNGLIFIASLLVIVVSNWLFNFSLVNYLTIKEPLVQKNVKKCIEIQHKDALYRSYSPLRNSNRKVNPRWVADSNPTFARVLIKNATIWTSDDTQTVLPGYDLHVENGIISAIGREIKPATDDTFVVDAEGRILTPALIDMHSHAGVESWPLLDATEDLTEITNPLTPFSRTLDALNIRDEAIRLIMQGGVGTSLIIPGSANIMGGFGYPIKHRYPSSGETADMLLNSGVDELGDGENVPWMYMKMACGENPKRFYGEQGKAPISRQGSAYLVRKILEQANKLLYAQNQYCASQSPSGMFPQNEELDQLVALLRGWVRLNIHCYEPQDLEAMVRTFNQYNVSIRAFHHALEAYRVPNLLKRNSIGAATFSDNWGYKKEAYDASVRAPSLLAEHGIPVAFKSDHPVLNAQFLIHEAAKARHYGFNSSLAFAAVTSVPAKLLGISDRLGSLGVGMDADMVLWDRNPLALSATPDAVFIDGILTYERALKKSQTMHVLPVGLPVDLPENARWSAKAEQCAVSVRNGSLTYNCAAARVQQQKLLQGQELQEYPSSSFFVYNASRIYADRDSVYENNCFILISNGIVVAVGSIAKTDFYQGFENIEMDKVASVNMNGGVLTPGMISAGTQLGLVEIPAEIRTGNMNAKSASKAPASKLNVHFTQSNDFWDSKGINAEGFRTGAGGGSAMLEAAFKNGIVAAFSRNLNSIEGHMVIVDTGSFANLKGNSSMRFTVYSRDALQSFEQQMTLSQLAESIGRACNVVINVNSVELLRTLAEYYDASSSERCNRIIVGGQGLYELLAYDSDFQRQWANGFANGVIVQPPRCTPSTWETRGCNIKLPELLIQLFRNSSLDAAIGIAMDELSHSRSVGFEAAAVYHRANGAITPSEALGLVTWNIGRLASTNFGRISLGVACNVVAYNKDPIIFGLEAQIQLVASNRRVLLSPLQL